MKFTIEVEDFYLDYDNDLDPALKRYIADKVTKEIWNTIDVRVDEQVTKILKKKIDASMQRKLAYRIDKVIDSEKIMVSGQLVSIEQYIKDIFQKNTGYRDPLTQIKVIAKKFGDELKNRYDLLFASQLVAKMNETGMLKEDVASKLIESKSD